MVKKTFKAYELMLHDYSVQILYPTIRIQENDIVSATKATIETQVAAKSIIIILRE